MDSQVDQPQTEEEAREANARLKKLLRCSPLVYTPIIGVFLWLLDVPYWGALVVVVFISELVSYPFIARSLDRNMETQIAAIRERDGITPAENLPDVGI